MSTNTELQCEYNANIDQLIEILQAEKERGQTNVMLLGQIKSYKSYKILVGKKYQEEQSMADWMLESRGF